ncbi:MAG TPA: transglycosylase SLT domain-containing protein [Burkholderiales bacterium]|nr:transglycosylase SLT domain-containing protein [Burkholderiales bacterium]
MHGSSGVFKLLVCLVVPLALAACAGSQPAAPDTPALPTVQPLVAVEVQEAEVENVDLTAQLQTDLWQRIRDGFAIPDLNTASAQEKTAWYGAKPDYMKRSLERARPFLYVIVEEIEKRGMPTELALLPLVESAYNPQAVSPAQAAGMWQFIPATGKRYNLKQDWWRDDRRDVIASTGAALDYLQTLYTQFGDWQLALAAYNWGEGAVQRAVDRARAKGEPTDYASLTAKMPAETAGYVPKLQAIKNIVMNPAQYAVTLPDMRNEPYLATITRDRDIDVSVAAQLAEMPLEEFVALNPSHNRPVIPGASNPVIVLPADKVETFKLNLQAREKPLSSWQAYLVKAGEKLEQIAAKFGIDLSALRTANGIGARQRVVAGHTLLVPRAKDSVKDTATQLPAEISQPPLENEGRIVRTTYVVRKGDSLALIAHKYKVSVAEVKDWNRSLGSAVKPGQKLTIETISYHEAAPKTAARGHRHVAAKGRAVARHPKRPVRVAHR